MGVSVYWPLNVLRVCVRVCLCDIKSEYQSTSKKSHVSDLSKLDPLLCKTHQGPSGTEVPTFDMCGSIISLSKIAHEMWRVHPFCQKNKTTERAVGVGVGSYNGGQDKI